MAHILGLSVRIDEWGFVYGYLSTAVVVAHKQSKFSISIASKSIVAIEWGFEISFIYV